MLCLIYQIIYKYLLCLIINYLATFVDVSKKFCFAPLQSSPIATKSPLYSFIISLKSAYVIKSLFDNPTFYNVKLQNGG